MSAEQLAWDLQVIKQSFARASVTYDKHAVLHQEVSNRMADKLDFIAISPDSILDLGANTGKDTTKLEKRYKQSVRCVALDISYPMLLKAKRNKPWFSKQRFVCGLAQSLPFHDNSFDMIYSNLVFQWCPDLHRVFKECQRVLKPNGLLFFSTYGPDTWFELRKSWEGIDNYEHVRNFTDMHDVGDSLIAAGFNAPVMDIDKIQLTYHHVKALIQDLRAVGVINFSANRRRGLLGKRQYAQFLSRYESFRNEAGLLPATYEIVYGHAWLAPVKSLIPEKTISLLQA